MNKLILHHFYSNSAFDLSNNRNHGIPMSVYKSSPPNAPAFTFVQPNSEVIVPANASLQNLWAIRAIVTFKLTVSLPITRRYNLMEGHVSFALFVESDGSLAGTIVDKNGQWTGVNSVPNLVKPNQWHTAELQHDGVNTIRLMLDGVEVGAAYNVIGTVKSIGAHGLAIGHWPEAAATYTFVGCIRETWLYKYDPNKDINSLLDHCCMDKKAIQGVVDQMRKKGETAASVKNKAYDILQFSSDVQAMTRGNDKATSLLQQKLSDMLTAAFVKGDQNNYMSSFAQLASMAQDNLTADQAASIKSTAEKIIDDLPLPLKDFQKLIKDMCLDKIKMGSKQFETVFNQLKENKNKKR